VLNRSFLDLRYRLELHFFVGIDVACFVIRRGCHNKTIDCLCAGSTIQVSTPRFLHLLRIRCFDSLGASATALKSALLSAELQDASFHEDELWSDNRVYTG